MIVGVPEITILPPVLVPAAVLIPAFRMIADAVVSVVEMFCETVKSPVNVPMLIEPVALIPFVEPTVPIVRALLSLYVRLLTPLAASVPKALLALSSVTAPPESSRFQAER